MNKQDIRKLLTLAIANFPNIQEKDMKPTAELWERMLSDLPYKVAEAALIRVLSINKFFPTIADIREAAANNKEQGISWIESWGEAQKAIRKFSSYDEPGGLNSLSPVTRKVMENIGWKNFCLSENEEVLRGQFRMAFEVVDKREREVNKLPEELKQIIGQVSEKKQISGKYDKVYL